MSRLFVCGDRVEVTVPIDHTTRVLQAAELAWPTINENER
mgnify:CR=1 FL=1